MVSAAAVFTLLLLAAKEFPPTGLRVSTSFGWADIPGFRIWFYRSLPNGFEFQYAEQSVAVLGSCNGILFFSQLSRS